MRIVGMIGSGFGQMLGRVVAGALLATVAGLAVAIPALFIYSYLSSRIKDVVSNMETFIDEFVTKMAEHYKE